jgi:TLC ATP/ADP transporter
MHTLIGYGSVLDTSLQLRSTPREARQRASYLYCTNVATMLLVPCLLLSSSTVAAFTTHHGRMPMPIVRPTRVAATTMSKQGRILQFNPLMAATTAPTVASRRVSTSSTARAMSDASASRGESGSPSSSTGLWSKLKSIVPPANERQKVVPLALMFFCILFNYTILRDTKDVLMITAPKSGAEVIPFIKTYVNLPVAIVRILVCVRKDSVFSRPLALLTL